MIFLFLIPFLFKEMPASIAPEAQKQQGFFKTIFILLQRVAIGGLHTLLARHFFWWVLVLLAGISLALSWLIWDKIAKMP